MLQVLLTEKHKSVFHSKLSLFLTDLKSHDDLLDFCNYFHDYYAKRPEVWAYCYRIGSGINTNMYAEAFHKVLKHVYFEGKKNQRLDALITMLLLKINYLRGKLKYKKM